MKRIVVLILTFGVAVCSAMQDCPAFRPGDFAPVAQDANQWFSFIPAGPESETAQPNSENLIDRHIFGKLDELDVKPAFPTSDSEFIRRVTLDLTGRIPDGDAVIRFLADNTPIKRERLIDELIVSEAFSDKWAYWLGELLLNTSNHGGVTVAGRNLLHEELRNAVRAGVPYDRLVTSLLTAKGTVSENGFVSFIARRTSALEPIQDTWDDLAADTGRIFLGMPMLCVSCHDGARHLELVNGYLSNRTREEFWSQAAFFSRIGVERTIDSSGSRPYRVSEAETGDYETDTKGNPGMRSLRSGGPYRPAFLLSGERPSGSDYRTEFARLLTSDFQFARAMVNRLWAELFAMGIVDPPDTFDLSRYQSQASHPELLDALAADFQASGFDIRHVIRMITNSRAYQLSSRYSAEWKESYRPLFARRIIRRLDAEQIHDSILQATGSVTAYAVEGLTAPVLWATQLPDVNEPRGNETASLFLDTLGRGRRMDDYGFRSSEISIAVSLATMNSSFVTSKTTLDGSPILKQLLGDSDDGVFVDRIFIQTLSRWPTEEEKRIVLARRSLNRTRWAEQLQWALINKVEFQLNY